MITIAIADDHKLMAEGVASILQSDPDLRVEKTCSNGKELIEYLRNKPVDVILIDLNMPVLDGPDTVRILRNHHQVTSKIVVLSMYADEHIYAKCRELDINGYLHKDSSAQHLIDTIKAIHGGENRFDYDQGSKITEIDALFEDKFINKFKLSRRELEIISHVRSGHTNQEIADMLFL